MASAPDGKLGNELAACTAADAVSDGVPSGFALTDYEGSARNDRCASTLVDHNPHWITLLCIEPSGTFRGGKGHAQTEKPRFEEGTEKSPKKPRVEEGTENSQSSCCAHCASTLVDDNWHTQQLSLCRQCYPRAFSEYVKQQEKQYGRSDMSTSANQGSERTERAMAFEVTSAAKTLPAESDSEDSDENCGENCGGSLGLLEWSEDETML